MNSEAEVLGDWLLEHGFEPRAKRHFMRYWRVTRIVVEFHGGSIAVWWQSNDSRSTDQIDPLVTSTENFEAIIEHVTYLISRAADRDKQNRAPIESEVMVAYARQVLEEGDFDIVSGTYAYFLGWHGGQSSWSYQALCVLGRDFNPGMGWRESDLEESEIDAYNQAVEMFGGELYGMEP